MKKTFDAWSKNLKQTVESFACRAWQYGDETRVRAGDRWLDKFIVGVYLQKEERKSCVADQ